MRQINDAFPGVGNIHQSDYVRTNVAADPLVVNHDSSTNLHIYQTDHDVIVEWFMPNAIRKEFIAYSVNHKILQVSLPEIIRDTANSDDQSSLNKHMITRNVKLPCLVKEDMSELHLKNGMAEIKLPKRSPTFRLYLVALFNFLK